MANVIVKEKALSDQNKAIESTKKREEDLAKKESRVSDLYNVSAIYVIMMRMYMYNVQL